MCIGNIIAENIEYKNETIPIVDKYVYLGVEINNEMDYDKMARFRVTKGISVAKKTTGTIANTKVPLAYKQMLLKKPNSTYTAVWVRNIWYE